MTENDCEVNFEDACDDAEQVQFYDSKVVTARRAHTCSECRGDIQVGDSYRRISYRFEGHFHIDRQCAPCHETAGEFEFSLVGGVLWEFFAEEWDNGANLQGCLNRLESARAKAHMRDQWQKWQDAKIAHRKTREAR